MPQHQPEEETKETIITVPAVIPPPPIEIAEALSIPATLKKIMAETSSYTLSRLPPAINSFVVAYIIKHIGENAVAAAPVLSTSYFSFLSIARGPVMVLGIAMSAKVATNRYDDVGSLMQAGYATALLTSVPIIIIFGCSGKILSSLVNSNIASDTGNYLLISMSGVAANLLLANLQQFTLAVKRPKIALISTITTLVTANGLAALLSLYFKMDLPGMATGYAASFGLNLIGLGAYLKLRPEFAEYKIFELKFKIKKSDLFDIFRRGAFVSLQLGCELGNLLAISLMMAKLGTIYATAEEPALQLGSIYPTLAIGFSQALGVIISGIDGKRKRAIAANDIPSSLILTQNIKKVANTGMVIAVSGAAVVTTIFATAYNPLTTLLIDANAPADPKIYEVSKHLFMIIGLGLIFDSARISASGALRGINDVKFASITSTICLNVLGLLAGGLLTLRFNQGAEYLFLTRTAALLIASLIIFSRLFYKIKIMLDYSSALAIEPEAHELHTIPSEHNTEVAMTTDFGNVDGQIGLPRPPQPSLMTRMYNRIFRSRSSHAPEIENPSLAGRLLPAPGNSNS